MTSKKLSPLRLKDIETGRREERKRIVEWLMHFLDEEELAYSIEQKEHWND